MYLVVVMKTAGTSVSSMSENVAQFENGQMDIHNDSHTSWPVGTSKTYGNNGGTNSVKAIIHKDMGDHKFHTDERVHVALYE
jgi:hypothetical protein